MLTGLVPLEICERKVAPGSSPGFQGVAAQHCVCLPPNFPILEECQSYWVNTYQYDLIITQLITSASQVVLTVKNLPADAEDVRDMGPVPDWEDPLE